MSAVHICAFVILISAFAQPFTHSTCVGQVLFFKRISMKCLLTLFVNILAEMLYCLLIQLCDSGYRHIDFRYLIPGAVVNDSGYRKTEYGLELFDRSLCGRPIDAVCCDRW